MSFPEVAILLESSSSWGAKALQGIADYLHSHGHWSVFIEPWGWYERPRLPPRWRGHGIIGRINHPKLAAEIDRAQVPAINLSYLPLGSSRTHQVTTDEVLLGQLAAEHFLSRGFYQFAYCGPRRYPYYDDHCGPAFHDAVKQAGYECAMYHHARSSRTSRDWEAQQVRLAQWLKQLKKPVAVFTWNAERGRQVIDACRLCGLQVPEDVAVLGGENDEVMCELSGPPMSGVEHESRRIGYAAAESLARMMAGNATPDKPLLFPPVGVIERQSTNTTIVADENVALALRYISQHIGEPFQIKDLLKVVPLSRRLLEYRFQQFLGRTPAQEIRRARLQQAQTLLRTTSLPIQRVAELSGFNHIEVMDRLFRSHAKISPLGYRRQFGRR